jgi:hypothetical protein
VFPSALRVHRVQEAAGHSYLGPDELDNAADEREELQVVQCVADHRREVLGGSVACIHVRRIPVQEALGSPGSPCGRSWPVETVPVTQNHWRLRRCLVRHCPVELEDGHIPRKQNRCQHSEFVGEMGAAPVQAWLREGRPLTNAHECGKFARPGTTAKGKGNPVPGHSKFARECPSKGCSRV